MVLFTFSIFLRAISPTRFSTNSTWKQCSNNVSISDYYSYVEQRKWSAEKEMSQVNLNVGKDNKFQQLFNLTSILCKPSL